MLPDAQQVILTCDPDFVELALHELRERVKQVEVGFELAPGVLLLQLNRTFQQLAVDWRGAPPIFVRHICPVHATVALSGHVSDLEQLDGVVGGELAHEVDGTQRFSVQARLFDDFDYKPFDVNTRLAETVYAISGATLDVRSPQQVVSVVCAPIFDAGHGRRLGLLGLSQAADNLSDWAGGARRFARDEGQVSRAEFKLLEALEIFRIELPPRGVALDLGAAPGGWTRVLRQRGQYVTAVDPGELDPRVAQDRGVRHKRMTAESYLAEEPEHFDLIVNDMRMDGRDSARLMVRFASRLHPGGQALMTVKLAQTDRANVLGQTLATLRQAYVIGGARQLFHNRSEITVWLQPKPR